MLTVEILGRKLERKAKPPNHNNQANFNIMLFLLVFFLVHFHAAISFYTNDLVFYLIK